MKDERRTLRTVLYLHSVLERELRRDDIELSLSQYRLLFMVQEGPARSVELATASGLTKPSISSQVVAMQERGWIERSRVEGDRRAASIRITSAGVKVLRAFERRLEQALERFLGAETLAQSDESLHSLFDAIADRRLQAHDQWALRRR